MAVDDSNGSPTLNMDSGASGNLKNELDIYADDDLNADEVVGIDDEDLQNEEEAALLAGAHDDADSVGVPGEDTDTNDHHRHSIGAEAEHNDGDGLDEDEHADGGVDAQQADADDLLYDAVITDRTSPVGHHDENSGDFSGSPSSPTFRRDGASLGIHGTVTGSGTMSQAQRKYSCYVGNLTWWTTDQDLADAVTAVGINDLIDVKFYENRANGQSKGFALVSFNAENSVRVCTDRLPGRQIHAQIPVILPYTKQSLAQFEAATRKPGERAETSNGSGNGNGGMPNERVSAGLPSTPTNRTSSMSSGGPTPVMKISGSGGHGDKHGPTFLGTIRIGAGGTTRTTGNASVVAPQGASPLSAVAVAAAAAASRSGLGMPPGHMVMRTGPHGMGPPGMPGMSVMGRPGGMPPPPGSIGVPPPIMNRPPPTVMGGGPQTHILRPPPTMHHPGMVHHMAAGGLSQPGMPPPGSHVNPNFYPGLAQAQQQQAAAAAAHHHQHHHEVGGGAPISDAEFEEIMNRNRTVSSSAISRAVSDAAVGDYASAIETLVTALSLLRQSKVAHDERCKVLIGSLQDTLQGIESKSYGGGAAASGHGSHHGGGSSRRSKDRTRRERSGSRERASGGGSKRRHRSRSRSRSRDRYADEYSPRRSRRY